MLRHICTTPTLSKIDVWKSDNSYKKYFTTTFRYFSANLSSYSHYVFSTLDHEDTGVITFEVSVNFISIRFQF